MVSYLIRKNYLYILGGNSAVFKCEGGWRDLL